MIWQNNYLKKEKIDQMTWTIEETAGKGKNEGHTSKNVLTQVDTSWSLAHSTTGNVENPIKDIRVAIVEADPGIN